MRITSRPVALGAITLAAAGLTAPAFAAAPTAKPTSLNLRAAHGTVAPKHHDTFTVTLRSGHAPVTGQAGDITLWERTAPTTGHKTVWTQQTATFTETKPGVYTVTVTVPGPAKRPQKDQYQARFKDTANPATYRASHSSVITVTVKPAAKK
jgi:ABC-type glycerol-3-phosphate transport system substrate-binding protein